MGRWSLEAGLGPRLLPPSPGPSLLHLRSLLHLGLSNKKPPGGRRRAGRRGELHSALWNPGWERTGRRGEAKGCPAPLASGPWSCRGSAGQPRLEEHLLKGTSEQGASGHLPGAEVVGGR